MSQSPGRECENGETQASERRTCRDGRGLAILRNPPWGNYKPGTKLVGPDIVAQLLECCDDELRKDLTRAAGKSLINSDEKDIPTDMKALAVRPANPMVARVALSN